MARSADDITRRNNMLAQGLSGTISGLVGLRNINQDLSLSLAGTEISRFNALTQASLTAQEVQRDLNRKLGQLSRDIQRTASQQRVAAAGSGLAPGSKSFLLVMNDSLNQAERVALESRNSAKFAQDKALFQGQVASAQADLSASRARLSAGRATANTIGSLVGSVGKIFGGLS